MEAVIDTRLKLNLEIDKAEISYEQRARANWLRSGDKNTTFFHKFVTQRMRTNRIVGLQVVNGRLTNDVFGMEETARGYFRELFTSKGVAALKQLFCGVNNCILEDSNTMLTQEYTRDEIVTTLKSMGPLKAFGDDGFPTIFFQRCWHIIGKGITTYYLQILNEGMMLDNLNTTNIVLILKILHPITL